MRIVEVYIEPQKLVSMARTFYDLKDLVVLSSSN